MALADIIGRIESDAAAEAGALLKAARAQASDIIAEAESIADREAAELVRNAEAEARARAETMRANARLAVRDEALLAKRSVIDRALAEVEARIAGLPDGQYAALIAREVAQQARGGDTVRVASPDALRLSALAAAVQEATGRDLGLVFSPEPAALEHGVVLETDRVSSEVSPRSIVEARREHLTAMAADILFGTKEA
jgi:vacuolar-type H+-ATPase subunit E/Vma4